MNQELREMVPWAECNEYHSPPRRRRPAVYRVPGIGDLWFFARLIGKVVWPARRYAVTHGYDYRRLVEDSLQTLRLIEAAGSQVHFSGFEHVRALADRPAVFVGNHMSTLDTFLTPAMITPFNRIVFVAKEALTKGFFGPIHNALDPVTVGREDPRADLKAVLAQGAERLREGRSVVLFPQRTRAVEFDPDTFNSLGAKLAQRNGVPLVPFALKTDFYLPGKLVREVGRVRPERDVRAAFGPGIETADGKEAHRQCLAFISACFERWAVKK